ncbi:hypothetical protein GCM10023091_43450 [Ravibacter arvi]|uniref:Beta-galactosidase trimerisation domain-containing protein n=2 Tax=Ravibacter arvi TaxID=2051041 RepID=A0ABP8MDW8_9BACT
MVTSILDKVRPDYIQIDCKGHPGYSSYPTKVGNPAPGIEKDALRVWRRETARRGVGLFMHYSGVWDSRAVELHPDWAVTNADGKKNKDITSVFGPYADQLLIPQLKELAGDYRVDGVWVDGECWATVPDYGERATRLFREATGISDPPKTSKDPHWYEWMQFNREAFRKYLRHYVAEVRSVYPDFQICSNWAFTDHMPEAVSVPLNFLSGDYDHRNSVNSARYAGRYLVHQGLPWDLMAWSFSRTPNHDSIPWKQKTAVQLKQEAAIVLALGGGFQAYFSQNRDGSIKPGEMEVMAEVAQFARERQPFCHHSVQIPQIGLLFPTGSYQKESGGLFTRNTGNNRLRGVLQALLEGQNSVDIVSEDMLNRNIKKFPLIVVPEWQQLSRVLCEDLISYVKEGGSLLIIGNETAGFFSEWAAADAGSPTTFKRLGSGQIGIMPDAFGLEYLKNGSKEKRAVLNDAVKALFPDPIVRSEGATDIDLSASMLGNKLTVHLVNTSGPHDKVTYIEKVSPAGPLTLSIRTGKKPARITLQPSGKKCGFRFENGRAIVKIDTVPLYEILVVE